MIRPVTIATFLLACGSGLYLYQSKHEVQMTDHRIEAIVRQTAALREQSRNLATEWTMLNDPERLRDFSDRYLHLKSIDPKQFTSLADLNNRLPPVSQPEAPAAAAPSADASDGAAAAAGGPSASAGKPAESAAVELATESVPTPPTVPPIPVVAFGAIRPLESRPAPRLPVAEVQPPAPAAGARAEPKVVRSAYAVESRPSEWRSAATGEGAGARLPRPLAMAAMARPVVLPVPRGVPQPAAAALARLSGPPRYAPQPLARPRLAAAHVAHPFVPARPAAQPAAAPFGGSLLGIARGAVPPAPLPTPVTYNAN